MSKKLYVNGKRINKDDWEIEYGNQVIEIYDEEYRDDMEYITDEFNRMLGVGWRVD